MYIILEKINGVWVVPQENGDITYRDSTWLAQNYQNINPDTHRIVDDHTDLLLQIIPAELRNQQVSITTNCTKI